MPSSNARRSRLHRSLKSTTVRVLKRLTWLLGRLAPPLASRLLANRFLATQKRQPPAREIEWLRGARRIELRDGPVTTSVVSWGAQDRPVVLLMHGWEGRASQMGAFVGPLVDAGYRVVAVDAPGHGEAPGRRSSILEMGQALRIAADAIGGVEAIVAHSGGSVAASYAVAEGLSVERLVFIAAPFDPGRFLYQAAEEWGLSRAIALRSQRLLERRLGVLWESFDLARLAPHRSEPLLVIHDQDDQILTLAEGEAITDAWPGAELEVTEGLGHHRILRDTSVVQRVTEFLRGGKDRRPGTGLRSQVG